MASLRAIVTHLKDATKAAPANSVDPANLDLSMANSYFTQLSESEKVLSRKYCVVRRYSKPQSSRGRNLRIEAIFINELIP